MKKLLFLLLTILLSLTGCTSYLSVTPSGVYSSTTIVTPPTKVVVVTNTPRAPRPPKPPMPPKYRRYR